MLRYIYIGTYVYIYAYIYTHVCMYLYTCTCKITCASSFLHFQPVQISTHTELCGLRCTGVPGSLQRAIEWHRPQCGRIRRMLRCDTGSVRFHEFSGSPAARLKVGIVRGQSASMMARKVLQTSLHESPGYGFSC